MILGITGAIGCGKSAALTAFAAHNWRTADADQLCHELYADPDSEPVRAMARRWGRGILTQDGTPDRRKIAQIVFADPDELAQLTAMLYPALQRKIFDLTAQWRAEKTNGALEIPLLYEAGISFGVDHVAVLWATAEIRHARLRQYRNFTDSEIRLREARQLDPDEKLERADFALINNGPREELELQICELIDQAEAMEPWTKTKI